MSDVVKLSTHAEWPKLRIRSSETLQRCALLRRLRFGHRLLQRQVGFRPAISAVRVPDHVGISHGKDSLCRIPRHPAIAETIDNECLGAVASSHAREIGS